MESQCCGLGAAVIDEAGGGDASGDGGDCDYCAVIGAYHGGQKLPHKAEVRENVDIEGTLVDSVG